MTIIILSIVMQISVLLSSFQEEKMHLWLPLLSWEESQCCYSNTLVVSFKRFAAQSSFTFQDALLGSHKVPMATYIDPTHVYMKTFWSLDDTKSNIETLGHIIS